jgi:peptide/nickel transport system substrate-binding protein
MNLGPVESSTFVMFNLNTANDKKTGQPLVEPKVQAWLNNTYFRQALNHSINRPQLVETVLRGIGSPKFIELNGSSPYAHPKLVSGFKMDVAYARQLLKQGGFSWNAQGQLLDSKHQRVELELLTNGENLNRERSALQLIEQWKPLGLTVRLKSLEFNTLLGRQHASQWHMMLMGLTGGGNLEPNWGSNVWQSQGALHMFKQRREYWSDQPRLPWEQIIDTSFEKGAMFVDITKRLPYYHRMQEAVASEAPVLYLYAEQNLWAVQRRLHNITPTPLGGVMHNMESVWVSQ